MTADIHFNNVNCLCFDKESDYDGKRACYYDDKRAGD